jgi:uncharacterized membrane protein
MAGIGFAIRKLMVNDNYTGLLGAYIYAGAITSGPWLLSIITIFVVSLIGRIHQIPAAETQSFQVIVVYAIAGSLIISSLFQHSYTRYIADKCYLQLRKQIIPSLNSIYIVTLLLASVIGLIAINVLLPHQPVETKIVILVSFLLLCLIWPTTSVLSGLLAYKAIFFAFILNFFTAAIIAIFLYPLGMKGLLISFSCGQFLLLMSLMYEIYKFYPAEELINFNFFKKNSAKKILFFTGLFYNIAIWADKFIFWYHPQTGEPIIENLHASIVYDVPIFFAYVAMIPCMVIFLFHMETDYADAYQALYKKVTGNNTMSEIYESYLKLLSVGCAAIYSTIKTAGYLLVVGVTIGSAIFTWLNVSTMYLPLLFVCLIAVSLNVILWATLDLIFYLDKLFHAAFITFLFMTSNIIFTLISIKLGILYFGYGLLFSLFITVIASFILLNREFNNLLYETYMLQKI